MGLCCPKLPSIFFQMEGTRPSLPVQKKPQTSFAIFSPGKRRGRHNDGELPEEETERLKSAAHKPDLRKNPKPQRGEKEKTGPIVDKMEGGSFWKGSNAWGATKREYCFL